MRRRASWLRSQPRSPSETALGSMALLPSSAPCWGAPGWSTPESVVSSVVVDGTTRCPLMDEPIAPRGVRRCYRCVGRRAGFQRQVHLNHVAGRLDVVDHVDQEHEVGLNVHAFALKERRLLDRVPTVVAGVDDLVAHVARSSVQLLLEQSGEGVLFVDAPPKHDGVAEHEDARGVGRLLHLECRPAQTQLIGGDGEPAVVDPCVRSMAVQRAVEIAGLRGAPGGQELLGAVPERLARVVHAEHARGPQGDLQQDDAEHEDHDQQDQSIDPLPKGASLALLGHGRSLARIPS